MKVRALVEQLSPPLALDAAHAVRNLLRARRDRRVSAAKLAQLHCCFDVMVRQPANAALASLSAEQVADLLERDAEHYRQSLHQVVVRGVTEPSSDAPPDPAKP